MANARNCRSSLFLAMTLTVFAALPVAAGTPPRLDPTFAFAGRTSVAIGDDADSGNAMAAQPDGKILVAGSSYKTASMVDPSSGMRFAVIRLLEDGSRDASFGTNGQIDVDEGDAAAIAIQPDQKILVAGRIGAASFAVVRLMPTGALDATFGTAGIAKFTGSPASAVRSLSVLASGHILVGGFPATLVRFDSNGVIDGTFGTAGVVALSLDGYPAGIVSLVVQPDQKLVAALDIPNGFKVARFNTDGTLDATFGSGGIATATLAPPGNGIRSGPLSLLPDGRIIATARTFYGNAGNVISQGHVLRFSADGSLDTTFAGTGIAMPAGMDGATAVSVQADGKIVLLEFFPQQRYTLGFPIRLRRLLPTGAEDGTFGVVQPPTSRAITPSALLVRDDGRLTVAGTAERQSTFDPPAHSPDIGVARILPNGSLDTTFASTGYAYYALALGAGGSFHSVAVQTNGKIVAAGYTAQTAIALGNATLARFNGDGTLDATFNGSGKIADTGMGTGGQANQVHLEPGGKIVITGAASLTETGTPLYMGAARFNGDGSRDLGFGTSGVATIATGVSTTSLLQPDGKIVLASNSQVARLSANGTADATFGSSGIAPLAAGLTVVTSLRQPDGRILLAGAVNGYFALVRLQADGTPDSTFGSSGLAQYDVAGSSGDVVNALALLADGRILAAGTTGGSTIVIARFLANGSIDTTFGAGGQTIVPKTGTIENANDEAVAITVRPDGRLLVAGRANSGPSVTSPVFVLLDGSGALDSNYGSGGRATMLNNFGILPNYVLRDLRVAAVALGSDGKAILAGLSETSALARVVVIPAPRGDASADLKADLYWRDAGGGLSWWLMDGAATTAANYYDVSSDWNVIDVADFNGDGRADLLWRHSASGAMYIWFLEGTSPVAFADLGVLGAEWSFAGTGDFNGDGYADILFRRNDGLLYLWRMKGGTIAWQGTVGTAPADSVIADLADLNADGQVEIIFRRTTDGEVFYWFTNGAQKCPAINTIPFGGGCPPNGEGSIGTVDPALWTLLAVDDFNGDGKGDLLWRATTGDVQVWLMNGGAVLSMGSLGNPGGAWSIKAVSDFTGDGKADLVWRHTDGSTYLWVMNGAAISAVMPIASPGGSWQIVSP